MHARLAFTAAYLLASVSALPASLHALLNRTTGQVVTGGAAVTSINDQDGIGAGADTYTFYQGDGSTGAGWPSKDQWVSYSDMFTANKALMVQSCGNNGWGANDSDQEIADINTAIEQVAQETAVDHRFILAIIIQESKGCVRVPTTNNGVSNPGLMQDHSGSFSCSGVDPCPADQILGMIRDGTSGTDAGDGIAGTINTAQSATGDSGSRAFYAGARLYNSGSADYTNLDNGLGSTACYASDVANRLTGWALAPTGCQA